MQQVIQTKGRDSSIIITKQKGRHFVYYIDKLCLKSILTIK